MSINVRQALPKYLFILLVLLVPASSSLAWESPGQETAQGDAWRFRVFLDEKEIGYHHFFLADNGVAKQLRSVASFEYRLMFVRLFHYDHENMETWDGNCLQSIRSQTNSNGEEFAVLGHRRSGQFELAGSQEEAALPECVMSFAYWNPEFLEQTRLLNTQNGEFLEIEVSDPVYEELEVQGEMRPSYRYRLAAGALNLDLWYSTNRQWLGLESEVRGGRKLRYVLEEDTVAPRIAASGSMGQ